LSKHRTDVGISGQPVPQSWFQSLMEYISSLASNLVISLASSTSVQVVAGTGSQQVGLGVNGKWRYNSATATVAHPGGASGAYDIYAVASENVFAGTGTGEVDTTDYTFGLAIVAGGGAAPTGVYNGRAIAHTRKIGSLTWSGTAISDVQQSVGSGGLSLGQVAAGILLAGTLAARPTASGANANYYYFASDSLGGIIYRSTGSAWVQMTAGVVHASVHAPGGTDALPWTTINGYGTLAGRPAAAATNAGYTYYATDTAIIYRSNGTTWDSESASNSAIASAINLSGTLAARPAAAAGNAGFYYYASDVGILYQSNGAAWAVIVSATLQTENPTKLFQGTVAAAAAVVYTVPAAKQTRYEMARIANTDTVARTVTLFDGGTAAANTILPSTEIPAGEWIEVDLTGMGQQAGGTIAAVASVAGVVALTLYGSEETPGTKLFKRLYQGSPTTTLASIIAFAARTRVSHIRAVNAHASALRGLGLSDGGNGAANTIQQGAASASQIPAGGVMEIQSFLGFANGGALWAVANGGADIVLTVYGVEG
jgi:hypothetical protein